ncbi:MAG: hypothetical protein ACO289_02145 [Prochlorococcaceae cyanobacterium]
MQNTIQTFPARRLTLAQPTDLVLVDPCYLVPAGLWGSFVDQIPQKGRIGGTAALHTGGFMLWGTTAYGDGFYGITSNPLKVGVMGEGAGVDSGLLALVPADDALALLGAASLPAGCALLIEDVTGEVYTDGRGRFELRHMAVVIDTAACDEVDAEVQ